jgi:cytochrome c oxidase assembly protein subunit 15
MRESVKTPGSNLSSALALTRRLIDRYFTRQVVRRLAIVTTAGMFLVILMGIVVTNTNSGHGCGGTWPLCNGKFTPGLALTSGIEYSHRGVTGIEGLLVVALTFGALYYWRARREIQILAPAMIVFLVLQSLLGAIVAVTNEIPELRALHFGVSLLSFVSILLTAALLNQEQTYDRLRDRPASRGFRALAWGMAAYTYVVVYTGAYVEHRGVQLACMDWPLCQGQLIPSVFGKGGLTPTGIVFVHRFAALLLTVGALWLFFWARRLRAGRPDLYGGGIAALIGLLLQGLVGALVVGTRLSLASVVAHGGVVALFFGALCYLVLQVTPRQRELRSLLKPRPTSTTSQSAPD